MVHETFSTWVMPMMSEGPVRLVGEDEWQLIWALFLNHLLCSVDRALLPQGGSFLFFLNVPLSLSIILHHESLTPSSITALTFRNYGLPFIWLTLNSCLTLDFLWALPQAPCPSHLSTHDLPFPGE